MKRVLLVTLLATSLALAGCTGGDDGGDDTPATSTPASTPVATTPVTATPPVNATPTPATPTPGANGTAGVANDTYTLAAVGVPAQVEVGRKFNFTLFVNGSLSRVSDHVGAHYANNSTVSPPGAGRRDCEHPTGAVPGVFLVNCTITEAGAWHVFGHVRLVEENVTYNYWAPPVVVKARAYNLTVTGFPTAPQVSNQSFTFTLSIAGSENVTSDHIGAHVFNQSMATPSVSAQVAPAVGSCTHASGATAGNYTITCTIVNSGATPATFYVRGHLRITEGGVQTNFWSDEHSVSVLPGVV